MRFMTRGPMHMLLSAKHEQTAQGSGGAIALSIKKGELILRVTVELLPGGQACPRRVLATANIAKLCSGAVADCRVSLHDVTLGDVCEPAVVSQYPRWAGSVWDLTARCIAAALNQGREELPPRPIKPFVTIHTCETGLPYVQLCEIP